MVRRLVMTSYTIVYIYTYNILLHMSSLHLHASSILYINDMYVIPTKNYMCDLYYIMGEDYLLLL